MNVPPWGNLHAVEAVVSVGGIVVGIALVVAGAEAFAEHLAGAAGRLGVSTFALAVLLAGAEPEELATVVTATLRDAPGIALGDVIGANVAVCLVALGTGALVAPLPFRGIVRRYAVLGLPIGVVAAALAWDGRVGRGEGALLVGLYAAFVAVLWIAERRPPELGEVAELGEQRGAPSRTPRRVGRELAWVVAGVVAMAVGALLVVDAVRALTSVESTQTRLGLTVVGFATGFELVVLAWSSARRGVSQAVVASVVGSFAYNATMTLGAGALARPLDVADAGQLHVPWVVMNGALAFAVLLGWRPGTLGRGAGALLVAAYPVIVGLVLVQ